MQNIVAVIMKLFEIMAETKKSALGQLNCLKFSITVSGAPLSPRFVVYKIFFR